MGYIWPFIYSKEGLINLEQVLDITYEYNVFDARCVFDRQRSHMTAKFGLFADGAQSKFPVLL